MARVILVHHHIFKNAGTSFNDALKQAFQNQFLEYDLPDSRVVTSDRLAQFILEHPHALAISGHHIAMPTPQGQDYQTLSSVLLRRPLARVRSIYEFEKRQQAKTEGSIQAKTLSFRDYVQWRLDKVPAMLSNYQTQYCARHRDLGATYAATEADLEIALCNLKQCTMVGTVERYEEFIQLAQAKLRQIYPNIVLEVAHLNVTPTTLPHSPSDADHKLKRELIKELGEDLFSTLEQNNQLDQKLYAAANESLMSQLTDLTAIDRSGGKRRNSIPAAAGKRGQMANVREFLRTWLKL